MTNPSRIKKVKSLLKQLNIQNNIIDEKNYKNIFQNIYDHKIEYKNVEKNIGKYKYDSEKYLKEHIEGE